MDALKNKMQQLKSEVDALHLTVEEKNNILKEIVVDREHAETELSSLRRQLKISESNLERSEANYLGTLKRLEETKKSAEECDRLNVSLSHVADTSNERLEELQAQLKEAKDEEVASEMRCHEVSKKLSTVEAEYEKIDKKATEYEKKIAELEKEMHTVSHTLHSLETSGAQLGAREEQYEHSIRELLQNLENIEMKRNNSERSSQKLKRDIEIAKENLHSWQTKCLQVKQEMDNMVADANNI